MIKIAITLPHSLEENSIGKQLGSRDTKLVTVELHPSTYGDNLISKSGIGNFT